MTPEINANIPNLFLHIYNDWADTYNGMRKRNDVIDGVMQWDPEDIRLLNEIAEQMPQVLSEALKEIK